MSETTWTVKKPSVPGLYWNRYMFKGQWCEQLVKIDACYDGSLVMQTHGNDEDHPIPDGDQWAGPLEPPR